VYSPSVTSFESELFLQCRTTSRIAACCIRLSSVSEISPLFAFSACPDERGRAY